MGSNENSKETFETLQKAVYHFQYNNRNKFSDKEKDKLCLEMRKLICALPYKYFYVGNPHGEQSAIKKAIDKISSNSAKQKNWQCVYYFAKRCQNKIRPKTD